MKTNHLTTLLSAAALGAAVVMASPAFADPDFTLSILVQEGDPMPDGDGTVGLINDISVNDNGDWLVDVNVSGGSVSRALIVNGQVWAKPGDPVDPDDTISSVANALKHLNANADVAWRPGLDENHSGIYFNFTPVLLRHDISQSPLLPPDTQYTGLLRARATDDGALLVFANVNDTSTPGTSNRVIAWFTEENGKWIENLLFKHHQDAPGTEPGVTFGLMNNTASDFAITNHGDVIFSTPFLNSPTATNGGIYINDNLIVRKGDPSPIEESAYANIGSSATRLDMSNSGDYIFLSTLTEQPTATNTVIVRNNMFTDGPDEIVAQRGHPAPGLPGRNIDSFGTGIQPYITDDGDAVWYARLDGDADTNQGLWFNNTLLIQKGVTTIGGNLITTVCGTTATSNGISASLMASSNGRFIILRARFEDTSRAALLIEMPDTTPPCPGDLTGTGHVGVPDLLELLANWGPCPTAPKPGGSCFGFCGTLSPDQCWCDEFCKDVGDCCEDICDGCPELPFCPDLTDPECPADLTGSGAVGVPDLLELLAQWGPCPTG